MGSIADLLGDQLPAQWQTKESVSEPLDEQAAQVVSAGTGTSEDALEGPEASVLQAVLTETDLPPADIRRDLSLEADLGLSGLPLWSVVAQVERQLGKSFPDRDVKAWKTLGDLLDAATA